MSILINPIYRRSVTMFVQMYQVYSISLSASTEFQQKWGFPDVDHPSMIGLCAILIAPLLSPNMTAWSSLKWHSHNKDLIHRICCAQSHMDMYSTSVEDKATVGCWHDHQLTRSLPSKIEYPLVDCHFSKSPPQSESQ